mmetsp:Transcript_15683/g.43360  ORF Transcript_15683/g.43360 Transcript_15683/m.43360 type:complete len:88 (+) Transcript_15683:85-348(+)
MGCSSSKASAAVAKKAALLPNEATKDLPEGCPAEAAVQDANQKCNATSADIANTDEEPSAEKRPSVGGASECCYSWLSHGLPLRRAC